MLKNVRAVKSRIENIDKRILRPTIGRNRRTNRETYLRYDLFFYDQLTPNAIGRRSTNRLTISYDVDFDSDKPVLMVPFLFLDNSKRPKRMISYLRLIIFFFFCLSTFFHGINAPRTSSHEFD